VNPIWSATGKLVCPCMREQAHGQAELAHGTRRPHEVLPEPLIKSGLTRNQVEGGETMADVKIEPLGPGETALLADLFNQVISPARDEEFFRRRFQGRHNVCILLASLAGRPVGFTAGFELKPATYFSWIAGVLPDYRRQGIATQLIQGLQAWAQDHHYSILRFECLNQHRPMLHVAIAEDFDLVGIRWDTTSANNVAIFEKDLR